MFKTKYQIIKFYKLKDKLAILNFINININTDIDIYINLGSAFYDKEDIENALQVYRNALDLDPENAKIHCNLGFLYWGKGDLDEAMKEYELAIQYDNKYDIKLFWKAFMNICTSRLREEPLRYASGIKITSKYLQELRITGINKQSAFDCWVLDIRKEWM